MPPWMPFESLRIDVTTDDGWTNMRRWLVGHRKRLRLTQAEVAERMGTSADVVSNLETGVTDPRMSTLARYLYALELRGNFTAIDAETGEQLA